MAVQTEEVRYRSLAEVAEQLEVPEGYRVEIVSGRILVSLTPINAHALVVSKIDRQLQRSLPDDVTVVQVVTVDLLATRERYIPDLLVVSTSSLLADDRRTEWLMPASDVLLAVEVTSPSNAEIDRVKKLRGYAVNDIPLYLLVDTTDEYVTLFSDPHDGVYRAHVQVPFGSTLDLPTPFEVTIETKSWS